MTSTLRKLVAAATLLLTLGITGCDPAPVDGSNGGAQWRCQDYIKLLLKAPATAHFSNETAVNNGDSTWSVTGDVDSENSFGANIRSSWSCVARDHGSDEWSVDSGNVDDGY